MPAVVALVAGGLTGCGQGQSLPEPTIVTQLPCLGNPLLKEKPQPDDTQELVAQVIDTVRAIRRLCEKTIGDSRDSYHPQLVKPVALTADKPGVDVNGCVLPSNQQMDQSSFSDRSVCFQYVPAEQVEKITGKRFPNAGGFFAIQPNNGRAGFKPGRAFLPREFIWRIESNTSPNGVTDFYYVRRDDVSRKGDSFQFLMIRPVPEPTNPADVRRLNGFRVWCVNADENLEYFGPLSKVVERQDATGKKFRDFVPEKMEPMLDRWVDYWAAQGEPFGVLPQL